jgi:hypothetical protein
MSQLCSHNSDTLSVAATPLACLLAPIRNYSVGGLTTIRDKAPHEETGKAHKVFSMTLIHIYSKQLKIVDGLRQYGADTL